VLAIEEYTINNHKSLINNKLKIIKKILKYTNNNKKPKETLNKSQNIQKIETFCKLNTNKFAKNPIFILTTTIQ